MKVGWRLMMLPVATAIVAIAVVLSYAAGSNDDPSHSAGTAAHHRFSATAARQGSNATPKVRSSVRAAGATRPAHIAVIVMENEGYRNVIGSRAAPFITRLARSYGLARAMYAVSHPSLPNYLALTGGSTFGISSDCTGCSVRANNLVDQLQAAGIPWKAYMENLPRPCFTGSDFGEYAKKHDPFLYYPALARDPVACSRVVPLNQLGPDELAGRLPQFIWITPNLCHDMHNCGVWTGDRFLSKLVPPLLRALSPNGLLFLTWDEGMSDSGCCRMASGGHIAMIVAGPGARRGARFNAPADHYSVLQTIEDLLGLPRLRGASCACTASLTPLVKQRAGPIPSQ